MFSINLFNLNFQTDSIASQDAPQELRERKDITKVITAIALTILCGIGVFFYVRHTNLSAHSLTQVDLCSETIRIITQLAQAVFQIFKMEALKTVVKMIIGLFSVYIVKRGINNWRLHKAKQALEQGNFQVAKKRIHDLPEDYLNENRTIAFQVKLYMRCGDLGKAGNWVTKLPNYPVASEGDLILKARFYLISGNYIESRYFISKAIKKNPGRADAQFTRAGLKVLLEGNVEGFYKILKYGISLDRKTINKKHLAHFYKFLSEFFKLIGCNHYANNELDNILNIDYWNRKYRQTVLEPIRNKKILTKTGAEPLEKFLALKKDILTGGILEVDQLYDSPRYEILSPYYQKLLILELYYHRNNMKEAKKSINELIQRRPESIYLRVKNALISFRMENVEERRSSYNLLLDFFEKNRVRSVSLLRGNYLDFELRDSEKKNFGTSKQVMDKILENSIFQLQEEKIVTLIHEMILHVS